MPYSDETEAGIIKQKFGISKSAFKRAIGKLMRERLITQKGSWTYLVEAAGDSEAAGDAVKSNTSEASASEGSSED